MTKLEAEDVLRAVELAGGKGSMYGPLPISGFKVSIANLPDVRRFLRAVAALGIAAEVSYSAGTGWSFDG